MVLFLFDYKSTSYASYMYHSIDAVRIMTHFGLIHLGPSGSIHSAYSVSLCLSDLN